MFALFLQRPLRTWEKLLENTWLCSTAQIKWTTEDLDESSKVKKGFL